METWRLGDLDERTKRGGEGASGRGGERQPGTRNPKRRKDEGASGRVGERNAQRATRNPEPETGNRRNGARLIVNNLKYFDLIIIIEA